MSARSRRRRSACLLVMITTLSLAGLALAQPADADGPGGSVHWDAGHRNWSCTIDGDLKLISSGTVLAFTSGAYMPEQGESHAPHSQTGLNSPSKLDFREVKYRPTSGATFTAPQAAASAPDFPYGVGTDMDSRADRFALGGE
jgi:hypothetical protein